MQREELEKRFLRLAHRAGHLKIGNLFEKMSKGEFMLLGIIERHMEENTGEPGIYVSELARNMKVSAPAVSRSLRSLEQKGLIGRSVDMGNRRNTFVFLTEQGRDRIAHQKKRMSRFYHKVVMEMGEEEMEQMLRLTERFMIILEKNIREFAGKPGPLMEPMEHFRERAGCFEDQEKNEEN